MQTDTLIIGAGPAGWLAAITAAGQGRSVTLCERMGKPGLKLLATGGGRCNLTHDLDVTAMMAAFSLRVLGLTLSKVSAAEWW